MQPGDNEAMNAVELVKRIQSGDTEAEAELIERYRRGVQSIIRNNGGGQNAEDLCQDTFVIALKKIRAGKLREPEKLSGFICHIARFLALAYTRRVAAQKKVDIESAESEVSPLPNALDQMLQQELLELTRQALAQLSRPRDRQILARILLQEEEKEQICEDMGLTDHQFNQVIFRARERFRIIFERLSSIRRRSPGELRKKARPLPLK